MGQQQTTFELREPASPAPLLPSDPLPTWLIVLAVIALVVAAAAVWIAVRHRRRAAAKPGAVRNQAYREALAAFETVTTNLPRAAAVQVSLILRRYLAVAAGDPSLFETHEEFVSRADSLRDLTDEVRRACQDGFSRLAAIKYAPAEESTATTAAEVAAGAKNLLETLHHGFTD